LPPVIYMMAIISNQPAAVAAGALADRTAA
jgi:hypothetical protein